MEFGVRKHYLVWPPFASRSATHLLRIELIGLLIAACGACEMLVHSSSMAVRSCRILAGTGTRCRIRRSRASKTCSIGDMSGEYAGHARTGMFSASRNCVQILATWGFALSCCNMRWCRGWMAQQWASEPRHVSLCIQNAINKMHLCSLFITYACPYHNPTATMGHSIHNVNISKPLTHTTPYTLSAICPVQWKSGFIREENTSLKCQTPSNVSICPLKSPTMMNWVSVRDPDEDDEHADELPWDGFWQFVQKLFGYANQLLQQLSGWLVSDNLGGEDAGCGGPGLVWLHGVCSCKAGWMYCQILLNAFGDGL